MKHLTAWILVVGLLTSLAAPSQALTINRINGGGIAPATVAGGGNLTDIFNRAADLWESIILDTHTVTITYSWGALGGSTLGQHGLTGQGGSPNRETSGTIVFDNDGSSRFFLDSTPFDDSEWTTFTQSTADYGGGTMVNGRTFTGYTGPLVGGFTPIDLLTTALHEIGHALGLSAANTSFAAGNADRDVDVTAPRPFAGAAIPTEASGTAHLDVSTSLMWPFATAGVRRYPTDVDIIANAQISQFTNLDLSYLTADATLAVTPDDGSVLDFGTFEPFETGELLSAIFLSNTGDVGSVINVLTGEITGPDAALFDFIGGFSPVALEVDPPTPSLQDSLDTAGFDLQFLGAGPGTYTATLTFTFDSGIEPVSFTLTATVLGGAVPEPTTLAMLLGAVVMAPLRRRQRVRC